MTTKNPPTESQTLNQVLKEMRLAMQLLKVREFEASARASGRASALLDKMLLAMPAPK